MITVGLSSQNRLPMIAHVERGDCSLIISARELTLRPTPIHHRGPPAVKTFDGTFVGRSHPLAGASAKARGRRRGDEK